MPSDSEPQAHHLRRAVIRVTGRRTRTLTGRALDRRQRLVLRRGGTTVRITATTATGRVLARRPLPANQFGEGLARIGMATVPCDGTYFITADMRSGSTVSVSLVAASASAKTSVSSETRAAT